MAPHRGYIETKLCFGYFQTKEILNIIVDKYDNNGVIIETKIIDNEYYKWKEFIPPMGFSLKAGHQNFIGKENRFIVDINMGFQYFPYSYNKTHDEIISYDSNGNKQVMVISDISKAS